MNAEAHGVSSAAAVEPPEGDGPARPGAGSALPQRFGRNVIMNYAAQGTAALSAIIVTPLLLHHLGRTAFGVWVLASGIVLYLELFELGFGGATTKLVAEDAEKRPERALQTLNTTFFALVPLAVVALAGGTGLAFLFPTVVHVPPALHNQVILVVIILSAGVAISIPGDTIGGALVGHQRFDMLGLSNSLLVGCTLVASIVIVELGGGLVALATALTVTGILFHFVRFLMLRRIQPGARIALHLADRGRLREVMHVSGWFLLSAVIYAIYNACDVLVVGIVLGLRAAAVYAVASKLATAAIMGLESLAQVFFPYASATARNKDLDALSEIVVDGTRAAMLVGMVISVVYLVLAAPGIRDWVGPGYGTSARVLMVFSAVIVLATPVRVINITLSGSGRLPLVCLIRGAEVAVDLALSVILAHVLGPVGVALGTLGGIALVRFPAFLLIGTTAVGIRPLTLLRRSVLPHVLPLAASAGVLLALRAVADGSVGGLVFDAVAGIVTYVVVYFAFGATDGERQRVRMAVAPHIPARWRKGLLAPHALPTDLPGANGPRKP
jgi:O-antigen/teichoic acid export membrane protein